MIKTPRVLLSFLSQQVKGELECSPTAMMTVTEIMKPGSIYQLWARLKG